jgi:hypothetical protein
VGGEIVCVLFQSVLEVAHRFPVVLQFQKTPPAHGRRLDALEAVAADVIQFLDGLDGSSGAEVDLALEQSRSSS